MATSRFLVVKSDTSGGDPHVWYVDDDKNIFSSRSDPREMEHLSGKIIHTTVVDSTKPEDYPQRVPWRHASTVQAIGRLDEANHGHPDPFHEALAEVFMLGMAAQRELDQKREREFARQERDERGLS